MRRALQGATQQLGSECRDVEGLGVSLRLQLHLCRGEFRGIEQGRAADVPGTGAAREREFPPGTCCERFGEQWPCQLLPVQLQVKAGFGHGKVYVAACLQPCRLFRQRQLQCPNVQLPRLQFNIERCVNTVGLGIAAVAGPADMQLLQWPRKGEHGVDLQRRPVAADVGQGAVLQCQPAIELRCIEDIDQGQLGMGAIGWQDLLGQHEPAQAAFDVRAGGESRQCVGVPLPVERTLQGVVILHLQAGVPLKAEAGCSHCQVGECQSATAGAGGEGYVLQLQRLAIRRADDGHLADVQGIQSQAQG